MKNQQPVDPFGRFGRGGPELARVARVPTSRVRFQLSEVLEPFAEAEAWPLSWQVASGSVGAWYSDGAATFTVRDVLGFWGAKWDRGVAELFTSDDVGKFWAVVENPGQPWYWAVLEDDITAGGYGDVGIGSHASDTSGARGNVTGHAHMLTSGQLDAGLVVRLSMFNHGELVDGTWEIIGAPCDS